MFPFVRTTSKASVGADPEDVNSDTSRSPSMRWRVSRNHHSSDRHSNRFESHSVRNQMHNTFNSNTFNETFAPPEPKRRAYDTSASFNSNTFASFATDRSAGLGLAALNGAASLADFEYNSGPSGALHANAGAALAPSTIYSSARYLEEENAALRRRNDELKKQVADLMGH